MSQSTQRRGQWNELFVFCEQFSSTQSHAQKKWYVGVKYAPVCAKRNNRQKGMWAILLVSKEVVDNHQDDMPE